MKKYLLLIISLLFCVSLEAQEISWTQHPIDGHRTGVTQKGAGLTVESMGKVKRFVKRYTSPNDNKYRRGTTRKVAKIMINAQDSMSYVKQIIGHSPVVMAKDKPECALTDWYIDVIMLKTAELTGKHVDVAFANFGGVRTDMPDGDIFRDDIMSMFPFRNTLYYFSLTGNSLLEICRNMAQFHAEIFGGLKLVIKDNTLVSATINGEPIDPNKIYGAATIDYLMEGNSWFRFGKYQIEGINTNKNVMDVMLQYVEEQTKLGNEITYKKDGRITIL